MKQVFYAAQFAEEVLVGTGLSGAKCPMASRWLELQRNHHHKPSAKRRHRTASRRTEKFRLSRTNGADGALKTPAGQQVFANTAEAARKTVAEWVRE